MTRRFGRPASSGLCSAHRSPRPSVARLTAQKRGLASACGLGTVPGRVFTAALHITPRAGRPIRHWAASRQPAGRPLTASVFLIIAIILGRELTNFDLGQAADLGNTKSTTDWLRADYTPINSLKALPPLVLETLLHNLPPDDARLADHGEKFNPTDVLDSASPARRFLFGGQATQFVLVCYEHGGRGHHYHVAVFAIKDDMAQLVFVGKPVQEPRTIQEIKELVQRGELLNDIEMVHQEW